MSDDYSSDYEYTSYDAEIRRRRDQDIAREELKKKNTEPEQPWWNDGDKVAGLAATIILLLLVGILIVGFIKFCQWVF